MEKKVSDNINNKNFVPNKDIHNGYDCNYLKSFSLERLSKYVNKNDSSDCVYLNYAEDIPDFIQVPIGPELQKLGIEDMALFEGKPIFKTESGFVVTIKGDTGFYQLLIPTQKPYGKHEYRLSETVYQLLNSHVFKSSLGERMNSRPTKFRKKRHV